MFPFLAKGGDRIFLQDTVVNGTTGPAFRLDNDGFAYSQSTAGGGSTQLFAWCTPGVNAGLYECVWTAVSGVVDSQPGAAGAALQLNVDRTWAEVTPTGTEQAVFDVIIRRVGTSTTLASGRITLNGDAT